MTKARLLTTAVTVMMCGFWMQHTAHAQLVGNYGGQRADGTPIDISVSRFRGQTYITEVQVQSNTKCRDGTIFDENTFVVGLLQVATSSSLTLTAFSPTIYIGGTLIFDNATRSVSGFLFERLAKLAASPGIPTKTTVCGEASQAFAAVLDKKADFDPKLVTSSDTQPR